MAFMTLKTIVIQNKKKHFISQFCSFYCLFVTWSRQLKVTDDIILVKARCQQGLVSHNLMFERIRYDFTGFDTVFSQKK